MCVEGSTHTDCMLAYKWVGKIELGPMVYTVKNPVVVAIWKVPHVDEVNLCIDFFVQKIRIKLYNYANRAEVFK